MGNYSGDLTELYKKYVDMKLYENDRHELVNEADRDRVWQDLYEWIMQTVQTGGRPGKEKD